MGISLSIKDRRRLSKGQESIGESEGSNLKRFTFSEIQKATGDFPSDGVIGEGASGYVYKGRVKERSFAPSKPETGIMIAVKRLTTEEIRSPITNSFKGEKEWLADIKYLGQLDHPNILKLIGYCLEDDHRLLIYEFMLNGSLENHLFEDSYEPLSWHLRMKVALGAAKGLAYLHSANQPVRYRFFTTSSILLDSNFNAKLSYSRIAMDRPGDDTHVVTRCKRRLGYVAPEYMKTGFLSDKCEVYSFGIVLLEILLGEKHSDQNRQRKEKELVDWVQRCLTNKETLGHSMDPRLKGQYPLGQTLVVANLASQCVSTDQHVRPRMDQVVYILEKLQNTGKYDFW